MDRRPERAASLARLAALTFLILGVGSGSEAPASTIQIMPMGDSVTYGYSDPGPVPGGYRSVLYRDLTSAGNRVKFVGSESANPDPSLSIAAQGHEGHLGFLIAGDGGFASFSLDGANLGHWLAPGNGVSPNLILLEAGSNEIFGNYHVASAPQELAALVTHISELRPRAEILLSTITPQADPTKEAEVRAFNRALGGPSGIVAQLRRRGEKVILVDAGGSLAPGDLSPDGLHPTREGYVKLGHAWSKAVESALRTGLRPSPAPEPSTLAILACGLLGLIAAARPKPKEVRANP